MENISKEIQYYTNENKEDYLFLVPNILPIHFALIQEVLKEAGYNVDLLTLCNSKKNTFENVGLCQSLQTYSNKIIDSLKNKKYKSIKIVLLFFDSTYGCFNKKEMLQVKQQIHSFYPDILYADIGFENKAFSSIPLKRVDLQKIVYAINYGDVLSNIFYRYYPYVLEKNDINNSLKSSIDLLIQKFKDDTYKNVKWNVEFIAKYFVDLKKASLRKVKIGLVYNPSFLYFNELQLLEEQISNLNAEPIVLPLLSFVIDKINYVIVKEALEARYHLKYVKLKFARMFIVCLQKKFNKRLNKTRISDTLIDNNTLQNAGFELKEMEIENSFQNKIIFSLIKKDSKVVLLVKAYDCQDEEYDFETNINELMAKFKQVSFISYTYGSKVNEQSYLDKINVVLNEIKKDQESD